MVEIIKTLINGEAVAVQVNYICSNTTKNFNAQDAKLKPFKEQNRYEKFCLSLNSPNFIDWLRRNIKHKTSDKTACQASTKME